MRPQAADEMRLTSSQTHKERKRAWVLLMSRLSGIRQVSATCEPGSLPRSSWLRGSGSRSFNSRPHRSPGVPAHSRGSTSGNFRRTQQGSERGILGDHALELRSRAARRYDRSVFDHENDAPALGTAAMHQRLGDSLVTNLSIPEYETWCEEGFRSK